MPKAEGRDNHHRDRLGGEGLSRRGFLRAAGAGGLLAASGLLGSCGRPQADTTGSPGSRSPSDRFRRDGFIVIVRHPGAVAADRRVDADAVAKMLAAGLTRLTGDSHPQQAWLRFFSPSDVIGLKVNCLGAPTTQTHPEVALASAAALRDAGVPADNLIIFDRLIGELDRAGYPVNNGSGIRCLGTDSEGCGYDREPTVVGEVGSCLSRIVSTHCSALLNLPLLKDHDLAGVSISLKNHMGCIHNPNKLHLNGCSPYVADLNLAPAIKGKQRLIVCDALEIIYDGGPTYRPATTERYGGLLISTDPVALDRVGWQIIEDLRARAGLRPLAAEGRPPRHISVAADPQHNLGIADLDRIERVEISLA
jgi:uncharacterized protein (DUF362 family)